MPGLGDVSRYPWLVAALLDANWPPQDVGKVAGGNFLRVWRAVAQVGPINFKLLIPDPMGLYCSGALICISCPPLYLKKNDTEVNQTKLAGLTNLRSQVSDLEMNRSSMVMGLWGR